MIPVMRETVKHEARGLYVPRDRRDPAVQPAQRHLVFLSRQAVLLVLVDRLYPVDPRSRKSDPSVRAVCVIGYYL